MSRIASIHMLFGRQAAKALLLLVLVAVSIAGLSAPAAAEHGTGGGATYSFLDAGFSQDLVGTSDGPVGDMAWASDGDLFLSECASSGSVLHRYDLQSTAAPVNGTVLHPESVVASNAGCGMVNHPNGNIYSNTSLGIVEINATTGVPTGLVFGAPGNALGIVVDPADGDIVYVADFASNFQILRTPVGGPSAVFVPPAVHLGGMVSEMAYDGSGRLYLGILTPGFRIVVVNSDGTWNRSIPLPSQPFGMAFHANSNFMVTMNTDGTITKIDLAAGDAISTLASGGGGHIMSTVGPDGCLYNTQSSGTTYDNHVTSGESSVVRICDLLGDGFITPEAPPAPPPPAEDTAVNLDVRPGSCANPVSAKEKGSIPVAILGTADFDVNDIDVSTLSIVGVSPRRSSIKDVAAPWGGVLSDPVSPNDCGSDGPDGHDDLMLKFSSRALIAAIGPVAKGDVVVLTIEGEMTDGSVFSGWDVILIKGHGKKHPDAHSKGGKKGHDDDGGKKGRGHG